VVGWLASTGVQWWDEKAIASAQAEKAELQQDIAALASPTHQPADHQTRSVRGIGGQSLRMKAKALLGSTPCRPVIQRHETH
jgi:hypothetical protein